MGRGGMGLPRNPTDRMRGTPWQDRKQQPEQVLPNLLTPEVRSSIDFAYKKPDRSWPKPQTLLLQVLWSLRAVEDLGCADFAVTSAKLDAGPGPKARGCFLPSCSWHCRF